MCRKKILFVIGSLNQTRQMHSIALQLPEYDCFFSQIFSHHPIVSNFAKWGLLDNTILGGEYKKKSEEYLIKHKLVNDYAKRNYQHQYDLIFMCSDLIVTNTIRKYKTIFIQEGMTDPITNWGKFTHFLGLPGYMAFNTAYNGSGNICDIYCAASEGYKEQYIQLGTSADRIVVTGIPNYDNVNAYNNNDFPYRDYVLVATSDLRETFQKDNRKAFLINCLKIADGRPLIFKLHPNEQKERAIAEIKENTPANTLIFIEGNTDHMIANCSELITQFSTVVYTGIALGKKVHSYFDVEKLKHLMPIQNGGRSAANIADIARNYIEFKGSRDQFMKMFFAPNTQQYA